MAYAAWRKRNKWLILCGISGGWLSVINMMTGEASVGILVGDGGCVHSLCWSICWNAVESIQAFDCWWTISILQWLSDITIQNIVACSVGREFCLDSALPDSSVPSPSVLLLPCSVSIVPCVLMFSHLCVIDLCRKYICWHSLQEEVWYSLPSSVGCLIEYWWWSVLCRDGYLERAC